MREHRRDALLRATSCALMIPAIAFGCAGSDAADIPQPSLELPVIALPAGGGNARATSASGAEFIDLGGNVHQQSDMLFLRTEGAGAGEYSYAVYALALHGAAPQQVLIDCSMWMRPVDIGSAVWIGLGDYSAGRWDWRGPFDSAPVVLDCAEARYASPADTLVVAVVVAGGSDCYVKGLDANPHVLRVWPGHYYERIEDAYAEATDGAWILVHRRDDGADYSQPALQVAKAGLHFRGVYSPGAGPVWLDGTGFNYSGAGSTPRAIFQFNPGADGCSVEGLLLRAAHNDSFNGAGVRINQANNILIRDCGIFSCDMGIMSNGSLGDGSASGQRIEYCRIADNGNAGDPGYNHNLYLGGTSVRVMGCEIAGATTGHNFKSRAHFTQALFNYVHDSANREFDLVDDAENTTAAGSHAVLIGNVIVKDPACSGNRAVIHFGQDGGNAHHGTLWLAHNTIVTPFISPVVTLSATGAGCALYNNIVADNASGQSGQVLISAIGGAQLSDAVGGYNWLAAGQSVDPASAIDDGTNYHAAAGEDPPFADPQPADRMYADYALASADPHIADQATDWEALGLPAAPGLPPIDNLFHYRPITWLDPRPEDAETDIGAYEL